MPKRLNPRALAVRAARKASERAQARSLAVPRAATPAPQRALPAPPRRPLALPAPKKQLALPPPDPAKQLPSFAAKPKGGQWWSENSPLPVFNPKEALKNEIYMSERFSADPVDKALLDWWDKAVPRYIQNDMATPDDPMRDLAARGVLHTEMTPDEWSKTAGAALAPISLQELMFGEDIYLTNLRQKTLETMPWLAKAPATDNVYGVAGSQLGALGFAHVRDELRNALRPDTSGIPMDLALRPESLARMSFPQAAERVGRINQFRVKQMEEQAATALNNPAIQTFKEYPEAGYRWVELRTPDLDDDLAGYRIEEQPGVFLNGPGHVVFDPKGAELGAEMSRDRAIRNIQADAYGGQLREALKFEGDTMGHCVGGYCDDVLSGRSRIFSLRDAKGQPHVTIETQPRSRVFSDLKTAVGDDNADRLLYEAEEEFRRSGRMDTTPLAIALERAGVAPLQDIVQIKGKQNRAPVDDYLPYVQDFVKSGTWGDIGDLGNTGLVKLPDGRYITNAQHVEAMAKARAGLPPEADPSSMITFNWNGIAPYFEGYAIGGRVDASRCFSRNPLSVRAA